MPRHLYFPKWEMRDWALDSIANRVSDVTSIAKKKDCLDLPPMLYQTIRVGMGDEQARAYRELEEDLITYLEAMPVTAPMALTKALRLLQIASGHVKTETGEIVSFKDSRTSPRTTR
jgi:hypothetical protein